jgi:crotonobetainyl-CoA:carnitine CoA-transferase CaiB-like acyl-CoA transferase
MAHRGFFEEIDHPVAGKARYSTLPAHFSKGPDRWNRRHAPLLGEHNHEVLRGLGLDPGQIATLETEGIIGDRLLQRA